MDLSRAFPRSPKQKMAGLAHLTRMIDKGRAFKTKKLANYIYPCPLDKIILNFLRIEADKFAKMTIEKKAEDICDWAKGLIKSKPPKQLGLRRFRRKLSFFKVKKVHPGCYIGS